MQIRHAEAVDRETVQAIHAHSVLMQSPLGAGGGALPSD